MVIFTAFCGHAAVAEEYITPKELAHGFVGHCVQNAGRRDKVEAAARVFGFVELSEDEALMLAPQDPNADYKMWRVGESLPELYFLSVSSTIMDGEPLETCAVANPHTTIDETTKEILQLVDVDRLIFDDEIDGQRQQVWEISLAPGLGHLVVSSAKSMGIAGGSIAISAPREE
ncbi:hypothetical protein [Shimia sp. W99]